jgi:hypothetical protein
MAFTEEVDAQMEKILSELQTSLKIAFSTIDVNLLNDDRVACLMLQNIMSAEVGALMSVTEARMRAEYEEKMKMKIQE